MMFLSTGGKRKEVDAVQPKAGRGKKTDIERDVSDEKPNKRQKKKDGIYKNSCTITILKSFVD